MFGALLVMLFVPLLALLVYQKLGSPQLTDEDGQWSQQLLDPARIEAMITDLRARVAQVPDDGEAWALLAGAHKFRGEHPQAIEAFERASALLPPNARLLAEFAESIALTQDNRFDGRPVQLLERALAADADEPKAIALMGAAQYQIGNLPRAKLYLGRLYAEMPADMPERQAIGDVLARIDRELGTQAPSAKDSTPARPSESNPSSPQPRIPAAADAKPGAATVGGTISLAPEMAGRAPATYTLFVVARAEQGSRIPLAVLRIDNPTLPLKFQLDDRHAMDPSRTISSTPRLLVEARLSRDGNAMRQPGDLASDSVAVSSGVQDLRIVIDREVGR
jgi:cytochrome c-type biogenesis protein CcmH